MRKINTVFTLLAINTMFSSTALSQAKIFNIVSILDNPVEGQEVTLQGQIIGQQPNQTDYIFTDGTSEITLEIHDKNLAYDPNVTLEISGFVDFESQHPEEAKLDPDPEDIQINVERLEVLDSN